MEKLLFSFLLAILFCSCTNTSIKQEVTSKESKERSDAVTTNSNSTIPKRSLLLTSRDQGQTWQDASYNLPADLQVSFIEPIGEELVIASDNLGVFLSSNNKTSFREIGTTLPGKKINALYISGTTIYVGVYQNGIYKSTDFGKNWDSLIINLPDYRVQAILEFDGKLIVGTDSGIFISEKDRILWAPTSIKTQVVSLYEYDNKIVAGTSQGSLLSQDGGVSWEWINKQGAVHYTHNIKERIWELYLSGGLSYSDDWGKTWLDVVYEPKVGSYIYELVQLDDVLLLSNNYGIHQSRDNGLTWNLIYPNEKVCFFDLVVIDNVIYGGTRLWDEFRGR